MRGYKKPSIGTSSSWSQLSSKILTLVLLLLVASFITVCSDEVPECAAPHFAYVTEPTDLDANTGTSQMTVNGFSTTAIISWEIDHRSNHRVTCRLQGDEGNEYPLVFPPELNSADSSSYNTKTPSIEVVGLATFSTYECIAWSFIRDCQQRETALTKDFTITTIGNSPPVPEIITMNPMPDSEKVNPQNPITIEFNVPMDEESIQKAFKLYQGEGEVDGTITLTDTSTGGQVLSFTPSFPLSIGATYTIKFNLDKSVKSAFYNVELTNSVNATFKTVDYPTVISCFPDNNATNVSPLSNITLNFSTPMNASTVENACFLMNVGTSEIIDCAFTWNDDGDVLTIDPVDSLGDYTDYLVAVTMDAADFIGNHLMAPNFSQFRTGSANQLPYIIDTTPREDDVTSTQPELSIVFDKEMDQASVESAFYCKQGSTQINGSFEWSANGKTITFTPTLPLSYGTFYTFGVGASAVDLWANPLANPQEILFSVASRPTIVSVFPADEATNISCYTVVEITFSAYMNRDSVITAFDVHESGGDPIPGSFTWERDPVLEQDTMIYMATEALDEAQLHVIAVDTNAVDELGNPLLDPWESIFTTETEEKSRALFAVPNDGTENVGPGQEIQVHFSLPMNAAETTASDAFWLRRAPSTYSYCGSGLDCSLSGDGKVLTAIPTSPLAANGTYEIRVTTQARDNINNRPLYENFSAFFYTASSPSISTVKITQRDGTELSLNDNDNANDISPYTAIKVFFTKPMDLAATEAAFELKDQSMQNVDGTFTWVSGNMFFYPSQKMDYNRNYRLYIQTTATDIYGYNLPTLGSGYGYYISFDITTGINIEVQASATDCSTWVEDEVTENITIQAGESLEIVSFQPMWTNYNVSSSCPGSGGPEDLYCPDGTYNAVPSSPSPFPINGYGPMQWEVITNLPFGDPADNTCFTSETVSPDAGEYFITVKVRNKGYYCGGSCNRGRTVLNMAINFN